MMLNNLYHFIKNPNTLLFSVSICIVAPTVLFGDLGFYGDDYNMLTSLESLGFLGSISQWQDAYGYFYRPLGITFLLSLYHLFGSFSFLMYVVSFCLYLSLVFMLYKVSRIYLKETNLSIFVAIFVASFPFNASAFLQLPSLYMIFTSLLFLFLLRRLSSIDSLDSLSKYLIAIFLWFALLLSYEQITGLVLIISLALLTKVNFSRKEELWQLVIRTVLFGLTTLIFMTLYFGSNTNPKITTLESLNSISSDISENSSINNSFETESNNFSSSRSEAILDKIERSVYFLVNNLLYSLNKILDQGLLGYILLIFSLIPVICISISKVRAPPNKTSLWCIFIGFLWVLGTLLPFLLYKSVHIPPYVLLLPSIGLALVTYGLFWLLWPQKFQFLASFFYKSLFSLLFLVFQFNQYGLYFGIKEELSFWEEISYKYNNNLNLTNINPKENNHIFWAEKLYGLRHFHNLTGDSFRSYKLVYDEESYTLSVIKKDD